MAKLGRYVSKAAASTLSMGVHVMLADADLVTESAFEYPPKLMIVGFVYGESDRI